MKYEEVKQALRTATIELQSKKTEKNNIEGQIRNLRGRSDTILTEMTDAIEKAKGDKLKAEEDKIAKPFRDRLNKLSKKKVKLKETYDKNNATINFDSYSEYYQEDMDIIKNARESLSTIEGSTKEILGDRLGSALFDKLENSTVELSIDDLSELTNRLSKFQKNIEIISRSDGKNYMVMFDNLLKKLNPCKDETKEGALTNDVLLYTGVCAATSFLAVNFLSPYILLGLFALGGFNVYRTYAIYRLVLESKLLNDNVDAINNMLEESINEDMNADKEELDRLYNKKIKSVDRQISEIESNLNNQIEDFRDKFKFDDSGIRQKYDMTKSNLKQEQKRAEQSIVQIDLDIGKIQKDIHELEKQLTKLSDGLADYYLATDRHGEDYHFDTKFLIDMDKNEPVWWEFPCESCLIIYNDPSEMINFIKLISVQLFNRLNPTLISIDYWDIKNLGMDVQCFNSLGKNLYNICGESTEVDESLSSLSEILKKRGPNIRREHNNIIEYNQYMLDMASVPESYNIIFSVNVNSRLFEKEEMERLILKGPEVGLYPMIFLSLSEFKELKKTSENLLNNCGVAYSLSKGTINNRAKRYYQKFLEEDKEKSPI